MKKLGYIQNNELTDTRLAIGFAAVIVAGLTAAYDYYVGFFEAFNWTAAGIVCYLILNTAYMVWIWKFERGIIYTGTKGDAKISIVSTVPDKFTPIYKITVTTTPTSGAGDKKSSGGSSDKASSTIVKEASFTEWFGINGLIVFSKFETWVKEVVASVPSGSKKSQ